MTQYVLKKGNDPTFDVSTDSDSDGLIDAIENRQVNFDVPTNPILKNDLSPAASVVCYEIRDDNTAPPSQSSNGVSYSSTYSTINRIYPNNTTVASYLENLESTPGWKIKNYDTQTNEGQYLGALGISTNNFFVVLFADDYKLHHVAKIERLLKDDSEGDSIEISPKYGGEIPEGTKFAIYQGPLVTDTAWVAVGYGLQGDATDNRHDVYTVCARPNFYFNGDKKELDHNTKYQLYYSRWNGTTQTTAKTNFVTEQDYALQVMDSGPFTMPATLIDNLRTKDKPTASKQSTESYGDTGLTKTVDFTSWDLCFYNFLRNDADYISGLGGNNTGPVRYIQYKESPTKNRVIPRVYETNIFNSITKSGTYAESRILDPHRIMGKKISRFDKYAIKQQIGNGSITLAKDAALPGIASGTSGTSTITVTKLEDGQDLRPLLVLNSAFESIQIGDYHYLLSAIAAPTYNAATNTRSQVLTVSHYRLNTATAYSAGNLQVTHTDATYYRRKWSTVTQTLMVDFPIDTTIEYTFPDTTDVPASELRYNGTALTAYSEARVYNVEISLIGQNMSGHRLLVKYGDKLNKYVKFQTYREQMYQDLDNNPPNILDYFTGTFIAERSVFNGSIESIEDYIEDGQFKFHISGRNDISKLLGPIVNKNYTHSHDYVYSTLGPYMKLSNFKTSVDADVEAGDRVLSVASVSSFSVGDYIFAGELRLIGRIESIDSSGNNITLEEGALLGLNNNSTILKMLNGNYISFGKAISTNDNATNKTTSLIGATGKGLIFTNGKSINSTDGSDSTKLINTSSNSDTRSRGYYINDARSIGKEEEFMCKLSDETTSSTKYSTLHTPNSMSQFSVIEIDAKEGETVVSLAPNCPTILGRIDENYNDTRYITLTQSSYQLDSAASKGTLGAIELKGADPLALLHEPVYTSTTFLGKVIAIRWKNGSQTPTLSGYDVSSGAFVRAEMLLDRPLPVALAEDDYLYTSDKKIHGFYGVNSQGLPNGGALHLVNSTLSHTGAPIPFSYGNGASGETGDVVNQYDQFLFRYISLQKGDYGTLSYNRRKSESGIFENGIYQRNRGKVSLYAPTYRSRTGVFNVTFGADAFNSDRREKQGSLETRGQRPSSGSVFEDFWIYSDSAETPQYNTIAQYNSQSLGFHWLPTTGGASNALIGHRENAIKQMQDKLEQIDPKMQRLFLFTLGDFYPESMLRWNHLGYTNRDLTDFSLILQSAPVSSQSSVEHTYYTGKNFNNEVVDESYETLSIDKASISGNQMRRFGLMRLTELTMDWHFNPINTEYPLDTIGLEPFNAIRYLTIAQPSTFATISHDPQISLASDYSSNYTVIALGTDGNTVDGLGGAKIFGSKVEFDLGNVHAYHVYAEDGSWLGEVGFSNKNSITLNAPANAVNGLHYANDQTGQTGNLYIMKKAGSDTYKNFNVWGRGNPDSFQPRDANNKLNLVMTHSLITGRAIWPSFGSSGQAQRIVITCGADSSKSLHANYFDFESIDSSSNPNEYRVWFDVSNTSVDSTCATTNGSNTVTMTSTTYVEFGMGVSGTGIPADTTVTEVSNSTTILISNNATATNNPVTLTFVPDSSGRELVEVDISTNDSDTAVALALKDAINAISGTDEIARLSSVETGTSNEVFISNQSVGSATKPDKRNLSNFNIRIETPGADGSTQGWANIMNSRVEYGSLVLAPIFQQDYTTLIRNGGYNSNLFNSTKQVFEGNSQAQSSFTPSKVFNELINYIENSNKYIYRGMKAVCIRPFSIENSLYQLGKGSAVDITNKGRRKTTSSEYMHDSAGTTLNKIGMFVNLQTATDIEGASLKTDRHFAKFNSSGKVNSSVQSGKVAASGGHIVFKPILTTATGDVTFSTTNLHGHKPNGSSAGLAKITVTLDGSSNEWMRFAPNLTGCYLASTEAYRYGTNTLNSAYSGDYEGTWSVGTSTDVDKATTASMEDKMPKALHYIMSHEIVTSGASIQHTIIIDNYDGYQSLAYRILQPNETCIWENTPNQIDLYKMSSKYTRAEDGEMYANSQNFTRRDETPISGVESFYGYNEAVQSMYVLIDLEPKSGTNHVVPRSTGKVFGSGKKFEDGNYAMYLNDGINAQKRHMQIITGTNKTTITLDGENVGMSGIVSFGEIFSVSSVMPTTINNAVVANISSTVTICDETETIIKDALENENVDYEISSLDFPFFTAPKFQGADLGSVVDNLAFEKDKELYIDANGIKIRDVNATLTFTNVTLDEKKDDIKIIDVTRNESVYDLYNEIIVYGLYVKSTKKNRKSIQKIGSKTLEHFDEKILTQPEADAKAEQLLILHSQPEDRITVKIGAEGTEFVNQGDIITMSFPSERINRGPYVILEVRRKMNGITEFEIGRYSKNLTDRLAELIVQNKSVAAFLRGNRFKTATEDVGFIDTTRVKELKLVVRHTSVTGSPATIGFGTAINAATKPIGFDSSNGSVNTTTILEEDL